MKKKIFLISCYIVAISCIKLSAQPVLYGTTLTGYQSDGGTLFSFNVADSVLEVKNRFNTPEGGLNPHGLMIGTNGLIYGTTSGEYGTIFEYNPITNIFTKKVDFTDSTGIEPYGKVVEIPGQKIIGTCMYGGAYGDGSIYEYDITTNTVIKLYDFQDSVGTTPWSGIFLASNGKLYGTTYLRGLYGYGSLYEFDITTNTISVIHFFDGPDGAYPIGNLCEVNNKLYGTAGIGGANMGGTIFEYDLIGNSFATVSNFDPSSNGAFPINLNPASNGLLYGITYGAGLYGVGTLFSFDPTSGTITNLRDFSGYGDGLSTSQLMQASDGNLYGTINTGYDNDGNGSIFQYNIATSTYSNLKNLDPTTGIHPDFTQLIEYTGSCALFKAKAKTETVTDFCEPNGSVDLTVTGTTFDYSVIWSNGSTTEDLSGIASGIYSATITVNDSIGCVAKVNVEVENSLKANSATSCSGSYVILTATGANTYLWSTGDTTATLSVNPTETSTYTVTGSSISGCETSITTTITVNALPILSSEARPSAEICAGSEVTLVGLGIIFLTDTTYSWSGGVRDNVPFTPTVTTTYTLVGTDYSTGCSNSITTQVVISNLILDSISICTGDSITLVASMGNSYLWNTGDTTLSITVNPTITSTYSVRSINDGCDSTKIFTVTVNALPTLSVNSTTICTGSTANLLVSGADTYLWNTGDTTASISISPVSNSSYTVTGTLATGCIQSATTEVTIDLSAMSIHSVAITSGGTATVTASSADTYLWSTGDTTASITVSPASTTTYTVTGTLNDGCSRSLTAWVTVNIPPAGPTSPPILMGTTLGGGQYGYGTLFSFNAANNILDVKNNFDNTNGATTFGKLLLASNGLIYGTSVNGGSSGNGVLYEYNPVTNTFTKKIDFNASITGVASFGYLIELPGGKLLGTCLYGGTNSSGTIFEYDIATDTIVKLYDFDGNSAGNPYLGVTLASNGKLYGTAATSQNSMGALYEFDLSSNTFSVIQSFNGENGALPIAKVYEANNKLYGTTAQGGTNDGGTIYEYDLSSGVFTTKANFNPTVDGAFPAPGINLATNGLFYGTTGGGGKYGIGTLYSFEPNSGSINTLYDFNIDSVGGSSNRVMQASDGNLYGLITFGNNNPGSIFQYNLVTSVFTVIKNLDTITGIVPNLAELIEYNPCSTNNLTVASSTICTGDSAILTASGADTFLWSTGDTTATITVTPTTSSSYTVTGKSANGCSQSVIAHVTVNALPVLSVNSVTVCSGSAATLTANGANTYLWSTGDTVSTITVAPTTTSTYTVTGTSANGCTKKLTATVLVNALPTVTSSVSPSATVCEGSTVVLSGSGASSYLWSGGVTDGIAFVPTSTTTYTVTGTDANGCTNTATKKIKVNPLPNVNATSDTICVGATAVIRANGAATYVWNTGATTASLSLSPGSTTAYTVTGTSNRGCTKEAHSTITVNSFNLLTVDSTVIICKGETAVVNASGANSYKWSNGDTTATISVSPAMTKTYTVTGTSASNGCAKKLTATVLVNALPTVSSSVSPSATVCEGSTVTLSGAGASSYLWSGGVTNGVAFTVTSTTTYTVTGTDVNGCTNTDTRKIKVNALPNVTATSDTICVGATAKIKAKGAPNYSWSTGATTASLSISPSSTTTYTVTGTNNNGCTKMAYSTIIVESCIVGRSDDNTSSAQLPIIDTLKIYKFSLYPNPSSGNVTLDYTIKLSEHGVVMIYDMLGKFISSYELDNSSNQLVMNNENLEKGTYFYKVLVDGIEVKRDKIIIIR